MNECTTKKYTKSIILTLALAIVSINAFSKTIATREQYTQQQEQLTQQQTQVTQLQETISQREGQLAQQLEKITQQEKKMQSLEDELSKLKTTTAQNISNQDKRITDLNLTTSRESDHLAMIGNYIGWSSLAFTLIAILLAYGVYTSTRTRAQEEAREASKQWFEEKAKAFEMQIANIQNKTLSTNLTTDTHTPHLAAIAENVTSNEEITTPVVVASGFSEDTPIITENTTAHEGDVTTVKEEVATAADDMNAYIEEVSAVAEDAPTNEEAQTKETEASKQVLILPKPGDILFAEDHFASGLAQYDNKDYAAALASFLKATQLANPAEKKALAQYWSAAALAQTNLDETSINIDEYYKRSIAVDPNDASSLANYAKFLTNTRQDHDAAEQYYRRAIETDPSDADNLGNYARLLLTTGKLA